MESKNNYLQNWTETLRAQGKYTFTYQQACQQFKNVTEIAIGLALNRLSRRNKVVSIFKGFYLIITPEYSLKGILPSVLFIDALMKYVDKPYYIGLLSAASFHGAAHQRPQEYFVVHQLPAMRPTMKKGIKINYIGRLKVPASFLEKRKTEAGYVNVSSPELTAIDLLQYSSHVGGLNRAATVIHELTEVMKPKNFTSELISITPVVILQRLGYIIEKIIGNDALANEIYRRTIIVYPSFQRRPLKAGKATKGFCTDAKWKVIINTKIDL